METPPHSLHPPLLFTPPGLPPHCYPDTPLLALISQSLGTCIPSYLLLASNTAGIFSIVSWLFAQMPQIWKNYRRGSVEGLSLGFLSIWLAGDICNLLGAIWTNQMWFQQVVGGYYVFVDIILVLQFFFFAFFRKSSSNKQKIIETYGETLDGDSLSYDDDSYFGDSESEPDTKKQDHNNNNNNQNNPTASSSSPRVRSRSLASTLIVVVSILFHIAGASPVSHHHQATTVLANGIAITFSARAGNSGSHNFQVQDLGSLLSWFSTILYLASRIPQLLLNIRRRSTSGLAISLFVAAFFGNLFYSMSLLLNPLAHYDYPPYGGGGIAGPDGNNRLEWWSRSLPFFLGAAGVLSLDAAVGWQYLIWGERPPEDSICVLIEAEFDEDDLEELDDDNNGEGEYYDDCVGAGRRWWPWGSNHHLLPNHQATAPVVEVSDETKPLVGRCLDYGTTAGS